MATCTTSKGSLLACVAAAVVLIPAAQKTDHGSAVTRQYSGSLFEQVLFATTEAVIQSLWDEDPSAPEELWLRAGADVAVVGGSIYSADDPAVAAKELRAAVI